MGPTEINLLLLIPVGMSVTFMVWVFWNWGKDYHKSDEASQDSRRLLSIASTHHWQGSSSEVPGAHSSNKPVHR